MLMEELKQFKRPVPSGIRRGSYVLLFFLVVYFKTVITRPNNMTTSIHVK